MSTQVADAVGQTALLARLHYTGGKGTHSNCKAALTLTVSMLALPFTKSATLWDAFRPVVESRVSAEQ
jgi:hypothetical protein